jgi:hypothetical protein
VGVLVPQCAGRAGHNTVPIASAINAIAVQSCQYNASPNHSAKNSLIKTTTGWPLNCVSSCHNSKHTPTVAAATPPQTREHQAEKPLTSSFMMGQFRPHTSVKAKRVQSWRGVSWGRADTVRMVSILKSPHDLS